MLRYGKTARQAVAAISLLAERLHSERPRVSSAEVGQARGMPAPFAAKLLSELSAAGLVVGVTGPGGGYQLARPPSEITLGEVVSLFERKPAEYPCPFGPGWCGHHNSCPLHDHFVALDEQATRFLEETTLEVFTRPPVPAG